MCTRHYPIASLGDFLAVTRLLETKHQQSSATEMLQELLNDHESLIRLIRQDIGKTGDEFGDEATADFLTGLLADHEKIAWKLRAYLS